MDDVDWNKYGQWTKVFTSDNDLLNDNLEESYKRFSEHFLDSTEKFGARRAGGKMNNLTAPPAPWWNTECRSALAERKAGFAKIKFNPSPHNLEAYKSNQMDSSKMWKIIKAFKFRSLVSISADQGAHYPSALDFIDKIAPPMIHIPPPLSSFFGPPIELFSDISLEEVVSAVNNIKIKSAAGPDFINNNMIKHRPIESLEILRDLFGRFFMAGTVPDDWKKFNIVLLPKPKGDGFRPIALSSCILKIFERIILTKIEWWIKNNRIIPNCQFGFRKNRSCSDNLAILCSDNSLSFVRGESLGAVFLDLAGAYDNVLLYILTQELIDIGLPSNIVFCIASILTTRTADFFHGSSLIGSRIMEISLPQENDDHAQVKAKKDTAAYKAANSKNLKEIMSLADLPPSPLSTKSSDENY
ncbi:uncharacterized protein LOC107272776, partial [Cephus cinctus]|uniref:Uncharacterized protein LOC107272776 n=1 Tax=Cephus cinctus TaxID=211228 RepID=A0AAJ7CA61_CEPCN